MSQAENTVIELAQNPVGTIALQTVEATVMGWKEKGFDFVRGAGAGFTAVLEGSVARGNWTSINAMAASAQGAINGEYNHVRVRVTVAGAVGAGTSLQVAGKC